MMVDTNVAIDLVTPDSPWFEWAVRSVSDATNKSRAIASVIVVGELALRAADVEAVATMLRSVGITIAELDAAAAFRAGTAHAAYRAAGGTHEKLLGDFLIGAHAETRKVPLATRDPKPYRRYFPDLKLITPETENG
jgi:predicted nucleic acid-binding protein